MKKTKRRRPRARSNEADLDDYFMKAALAEAEKSGRAQEVPVGAVLVRDGRIIGRGRNGPISKNDPTAHAEIEAIRRASRKSRNYRLPGCQLYVTLEPCTMCLGAVVQARLSRLVYGTPDPKGGAVRSIMRFPFARLNHRPAIRGGVLKEDCARLLVDFFKKRRRK